MHQWSCQADEQHYREVIDRDHCLVFVLGLNDKFEDMGGRIMSMKSIPILEDAFNIIKNEESRSDLVKNRPPTYSIPTVKSSAMLARNNQGRDSKVKKFLKCDHCNKNGHTRDTSWKIHGRPDHLKQRPKGDGKAYMIGELSQNNEVSIQEELSITSSFRKIFP